MEVAFHIYHNPFMPVGPNSFGTVPQAEQVRPYAGPAATGCKYLVDVAFHIHHNRPFA